MLSLNFKKKLLVLSVLLGALGTSHAQKPVIYQTFVRLFGNANTQNLPFGTIQQNGVGKFGDFSDRCLDSLKALHINYIWYMGVISHATTTSYPALGLAADDPDIVKGRAGSPYAIRDYYDVDADLANDPARRMSEFEELVQRTHRHGLKVLIDFIPNHVARTYHEKGIFHNTAHAIGAQDDTSLAFSPKNDFYYIPGQQLQIPIDHRYDSGVVDLPGLDGKFFESPAKATGNDVFSSKPSVSDWYETIKLNYGVDYQKNKTTHFDPIPDLWPKMKSILEFWAAKGVDGFRCDMVEMVPTEFWQWVIPTLKQKYPQLIFIGEAYDTNKYASYLNAGFTYLYDKVGMYDALKAFYSSSNGNAENLDSIEHARSSQQFVRFLENHDEVRVHSSDFTNYPLDAFAAMTVVATMGKNPILLYAGQEVGETADELEGFGTKDSRTTLFDYWSLPHLQAWMNNGKYDGGELPDSLQTLRQKYQDLLAEISENKAFSEGKYHCLFHSPKLIVYTRTYQNLRYLVLVNFDQKKSVDYSVHLSALQSGKNKFSIETIFQSKSIRFHKNKRKLMVQLPAMSGTILKY